jgi:hypothetical protein
MWIALGMIKNIIVLLIYKECVMQVKNTVFDTLQKDNRLCGNKSNVNIWNIDDKGKNRVYVGLGEVKKIIGDLLSHEDWDESSSDDNKLAQELESIFASVYELQNKMQ